MHTIKYILIIISLQTAIASDWAVDQLSMNTIEGMLQIQAESLYTPFFDKALKKIKYQCKKSQQLYPQHNCANGSIAFTYGTVEYVYLIKGWFNLSNHEWDINLTNTTEEIQIHTDSRHSKSVEITVDQLGFQKLSQMLNQFVTIKLDDISANISADIYINFDQQPHVKMKYNIEELNWETGEYVFADNNIQGEMLLKQINGFLDITLTNYISKGEALIKDLYILFDDYPLEIIASFKLDKIFNLINPTVKINGNEGAHLEIFSSDWQQQVFEIEYSIKNLKSFHDKLMVSYLEILGINDLDIIGELNGKLTLKDGNITSINAQLSEMFVELESKKISVENLTADINWQNKGLFQTSEISWDSMLLAGMPINQSQLQFDSVSEHLRLKKGTIIPIFDGSIVIYELKLEDVFQPEINIVFDGEVKPISLALITEKMGWPAMNGVISGLIPGMKKIGHSITFDGSLDIKVFNGNMQIEHLSIERLFGIAPVIAADIYFDKLSLKQITSTFDFGEITGFINGYVKELRVTNWKADRLDAYVHTVKAKKIKQTISQRAIDNISSIGGVQGALSRSFLRFFNAFKYKQIGIGCKLRNSICEMRGINSVGESYTLIEGKSIPSINIVGIRKYIDWEVLLNRLLTANY